MSALNGVKELAQLVGKMTRSAHGGHIMQEVMAQSF